VSPDFSPPVLAAADEAARAPRLPAVDRTDIPLVTVDPPGARDLDQAVFLERRAGGGYRVCYAIADVAAFVRPGDPVDQEAHRRGETLYAADSSVPLHPPVLAHDAASLLPDRMRPALLWTIDLDAAGEATRVDVRRALVRSRAQLTYAEVQQRLDRGGDDEFAVLLRDVGRLRQQREQVRGGVDLPLPEQEIVVHGDRWSLEFRAQLPVERWNAQISLLTGMAAAQLMLHGEVGLLRTMPDPDPHVVQRLHRTAAALGIDWPAEQLYPDFIRGLDPRRPHHAAMVTACTALLRGAGYVGFDGGVPERPEHAALAAEYAHVTAPLRRLADRYAGEVCVALCAGASVPEWVRAELRQLPRTMQESARRAAAYESGVVSLVEAGVLASRLGEMFDGVITEVDADDPCHGSVVVVDPAVEARVQGAARLPLGARVRVRLVEADVERRVVRFALASS
ncbi:MAG: RNB domain-containing ribonuclease, partial [Actinomycetota bacterium]|nr:RNB domain-containing ribonuclease [Actinomycetota bacterium]